MMMKSLCKRLWLLAIPLGLLVIATIAAAQSVPGFTVTTFATGITGARLLSTDPAGNVYTMGRDDGRVFKITPAGAVSLIVDLSDVHRIGPHFDPVSGDLFVSCDASSDVFRITTSGSVSVFASGISCGSGFDNDGAGNIYVSEFSAGRVSKITPGGTVSTYATGLSLPDGIDFGPSGELYVGNRGTNQIMRVPPGGGVATVFASGMSSPLDVVSDSAGNVFVANFGNGTISKISPAGVVSTFGTGFANPLGLDFDPSGNLFIADFGTGVIYKVAGVSPPANQPPDCSNAAPSESTLWPPNHKFVAIDITGVTDPDGDTISINIDSIFQDEPVKGKGDGNTSPDGQGINSSTAEVRAERSGQGDGRVYHIFYTAYDGNGGTCTGEVLVDVPHDQASTPVDGGALYDSTTP